MIFSDRLTAIIVSRFLLHLQAASQGLGTGGTTGEGDVGQGTLLFASVVGSLATNIDPADFVEEMEGAVNYEEIFQEPSLALEQTDETSGADQGDGTTLREVLLDEVASVSAV